MQRDLAVYVEDHTVILITGQMLKENAHGSENMDRAGDVDEVKCMLGGDKGEIYRWELNGKRIHDSGKKIAFRPERAEALDYDRENQLRILLLHFNIAFAFSQANTKKSPSGTGYHIYTDSGFTLEQSNALGDCAGRLYYWSAQGYTFTFKRKGKGVEEGVNILSEPFWVAREGRRRRRKR